MKYQHMLTFLHQDSTLCEKIAYIDPTPDILQQMGIDPIWSGVFQAIQTHVGLRFLHISFFKILPKSEVVGYSILTEDCKVSIIWTGTGSHRVSPSNINKTGNINLQSPLDGFIDRMKMNSGSPKPLLTQYLYKQFYIKCYCPMKSEMENDFENPHEVNGQTAKRCIEEFTDVIFDPWLATLEQDYVYKTFDVVAMKQVYEDLQKSFHNKIRQCDDLNQKCKELEMQIITRNDALTLSCTEIFQMRQQLNEKDVARVEVDNKFVQSKIQNENYRLQINELENMLKNLKEDMESKQNNIKNDKILEQEQCILRLTEKNRSLRKELTTIEKTKVSVIINNHKISSSDDLSSGSSSGADRKPRNRVIVQQEAFRHQF